jgi:hypothetical protein
VYTDVFGTRKGDDNSLVADVGGRVVGAVWTRIMDDYGHVDDETPSFAISLYKEYRGSRSGHRLTAYGEDARRGRDARQSAVRCVPCSWPLSTANTLNRRCEPKSLPSRQAFWPRITEKSQ